VDGLLADPLRRQQLAKQARKRILEQGYDLPTCLERQLELVERVMG